MRGLADIIKVLTDIGIDVKSVQGEHIFGNELHTEVLSLSINNNGKKYEIQMEVLQVQMREVK